MKQFISGFSYALFWGFKPPFQKHDKHPLSQNVFYMIMEKLEWWKLRYLRGSVCFQSILGFCLHSPLPVVVKVNTEPSSTCQVIKSCLPAYSQHKAALNALSVHYRDSHRLDLGPLFTGMALSSVRMHRYSPMTAMRAMQAALTSHHDRAAGRWEL